MHKEKIYLARSVRIISFTENGMITIYHNENI